MHIWKIPSFHNKNFVNEGLTHLWAIHLCNLFLANVLEIDLKTNPLKPNNISKCQQLLDV